jgi:hypothetical protein
MGVRSADIIELVIVVTDGAIMKESIGAAAGA